MESRIIEPISSYKKSNRPPILGFLIADKHGKSIFTIEAYTNCLYEHVVTPERKDHFDLDLIPMFLSAFHSFSADIEFRYLRTLTLEGINLRMDVFYGFEGVTIIFFGSPEVPLAPFQEHIRCFFEGFYEKNRQLKDACMKKMPPSLAESVALKLQGWLGALNYKISSWFTRHRF